MIDDLFACTDPTQNDYSDIDLGDASLRHYPDFLSRVDADGYFTNLMGEIAWRQEIIEMYGVKRPIPRLSAWYGDPNVFYEYSGIGAKSNIWTATLKTIKEKIEESVGHRFNGVLANLYRDGQDSVSWHSDDEGSLGQDPIVASISLGDTRRFQLRRKQGDRRSVNIDLSHGSLLVMQEGTQVHWQHQLPKTRQVVGARINLTFRYVYPGL